jgi:hypothetical protein
VCLIWRSSTYIPPRHCGWWWSWRTRSRPCRCHYTREQKHGTIANHLVNAAYDVYFVKDSSLNSNLVKKDQYRCFSGVMEFPVFGEVSDILAPVITRATAGAGHDATPPDASAEATTEASVSRVLPAPLTGDTSGLVLVAIAPVNSRPGEIWAPRVALWCRHPQFGGSDANIIDWAESAVLRWTMVPLSIAQPPSVVDRVNTR